MPIILFFIRNFESTSELFHGVIFLDLSVASMSYRGSYLQYANEWDVNTLLFIFLVAEYKQHHL